MGSGLELKIPSQTVLALPNPEVGTFLYGTKINPSLKLELGFFFAEFRVEGAYTNANQTPMKVNYFDAAPSGSLSKASPLSLWNLEPKSDEDTVRGNFGIRSLSIGFNIHRDVKIRLGPHRYDITQAESHCTEGFFGPQCKFAFISPPLGWLGGQLEYDRQNKTGEFRRGNLSAALTETGLGSLFALFQGLLVFGFGEAEDDWKWTLHGYSSVHSNQQEDEEAKKFPKNTLGFGFLTQVEHKDFVSGVGLGRQNGVTQKVEGFEELDDLNDRSIFYSYVGFNPGKFRTRAMVGMLRREDSGDILNNPPTPQSEVHTELSGGFEFIDGLRLVLGYRGAYGEERQDHIGFVALGTNFKPAISFETKE